MKKSIPNSVCVGALVMGAIVVAHCGGDDSARPGTGAGGSSVTGFGGSSSVGTGGAVSGAGGTVSTGVGGSTGLGGSVSTGTGGTTGAGGSPSNTFCPAVEPTPGDACTPPPADAGPGANACPYPGANGGAGMTCSCRAGNMRNDAGMRTDAWVCNAVFMRPDAGPPPVVDAGLMDMCPANNVPNNGNCAQFVTGLVCPGAGGRMCTCRAGGMGGGGAKTWNCPMVVPDAGPRVIPDAGRGGG